MRFEVTILFPGFSGKLPYCAHGWGTWALIRDGKHNILLDTGGVGLRLNFHRILEEQGVRAEDIDYVLLTHMHFDHVWNGSMQMTWKTGISLFRRAPSCPCGMRKRFL